MWRLSFGGKIWKIDIDVRSVPSDTILKIYLEKCVTISAKRDKRAHIYIWVSET